MAAPAVLVAHDVLPILNCNRVGRSDNHTGYLRQGRNKAGSEHQNAQEVRPVRWILHDLARSRLATQVGDEMINVEPSARRVFLYIMRCSWKESLLACYL
jgi:hypothetical protein